MACNSLDSAYRGLFLSFPIVVGFTPSLWWEPGPGTVVAMPPAAPCLEDEAAEHWDYVIFNRKCSSTVHLREAIDVPLMAPCCGTVAGLSPASCLARDPERKDFSLLSQSSVSLSGETSDGLSQRQAASISFLFDKRVWR